MSRVAQGDRAALGELVGRHRDDVLRLAYRVLGRWDLAEDVAQDAFVRVQRAARRYRPTAAFTTWLHRIVVNLCLDTMRRRRPAPVAAPADTGECDPIESAELGEVVRRAVGALPERQRVALVLRRYHGLTNQQVAEVTGWSESAVESLMVRAFSALREELSEMLGEDRREPPVSAFKLREEDSCRMPPTQS